MPLIERVRADLASVASIVQSLYVMPYQTHGFKEFISVFTLVPLNLLENLS